MIGSGMQLHSSEWRMANGKKANYSQFATRHSPFAKISHRAFRHGAVAQGPALDRSDGLLDHQHEEDELQGPGDGAGHVEEMLLAQQLVADTAGRADEVG